VLALGATVLVNGMFSTKASPAFQINIDPGAYTGHYLLISDTLTEYRGSQTLQLVPGSYAILSLGRPSRRARLPSTVPRRIQQAILRPARSR
jgi:hypothetical protein